MRTALTILIILAGLGIVVATYLGQSPTAPSTSPAPAPPVSEAPVPPPPVSEATPQQEVETETLSESPVSPPAASVADSDATAVGEAGRAEPLGTLSVEPADQARIAMIGSRDTDGDYDLYMETSAWGASILQIDVADYKQKIDEPDPYTLMMFAVDPSAEQGRNYVFPFAATAITINGQRVTLGDQRWHLIEPTSEDNWRTTLAADPLASPPTPTSRAVYELPVVDEDGQAVALLRRTYELLPDSHDIHLTQTIENRLGTPLEVVWEQNAQVSPMKDDASYMGDRRQLMAGYFDLVDDPRKVNIYVDDAIVSYDKAVNNGQTLYPNSDLPARTELVWASMINRYFALAVHPEIPTDGSITRPTMPTLEESWATLGQRAIGQFTKNNDISVLLFTLTSEPLTIAPGGRGELPLSLYAGPRLKSEFARQPYAMMDFDRMIRYELGCALCTFQPLARGLLWFLKAIHAVVGDWGISILVLVAVVRLILHPITKKSQVSMMKMGKQMQTLKPELDKLKKRYPDDPQKFQKEQMQLFREKGINPANFLGCLPMFLQTPIWIALYAMLYLAIELYHQPAFYGVFQMFGNWQFLADLSQPDRFIRFFNEPKTISLLVVPFDYSSLNILPLLWGVVMVGQQHYMTPPAASEQAAQQQKIMKWVMLLFPVMLYAAPSGLMLYILASTSAGMLDSYLVRKHIKELEDKGQLFDKKKPREVKPGGLMDRLQKVVEQKQKQMEQMQDKPRPGDRGGRGNRGNRGGRGGKR